MIAKIRFSLNYEGLGDTERRRCLSAVQFGADTPHESRSQNNVLEMIED